MKADPQAGLLDTMSEDQTLEMLGPSWAEMSAAERRAYGYPGRRVPAERRTARRRWWEAA